MPQQPPTAERQAWAGASRDDVHRVFAGINQNGLSRSNPATAAQLLQPASDTPTTVDPSRVVPVLPELAGDVLPCPGLRRGTVVTATGSTSLLLALLAGAMQHGAWAAWSPSSWLTT